MEDLEVDVIKAAAQEGNLDGFFNVLLDNQVTVAVSRYKYALEKQFEQIEKGISTLVCTKEGCGEQATRFRYEPGTTGQEDRKCEKHQEDMKEMSEFREDVIQKVHQLRDYVLWSEILYLTCSAHKRIKNLYIEHVEDFKKRSKKVGKHFEENMQKILNNIKEQGSLNQFNFLFSVHDAAKKITEDLRKELSELFTRRYCQKVGELFVTQLQDTPVTNESIAINVTNVLGMRADEVMEFLENNDKKVQRERKIQEEYEDLQELISQNTKRIESLHEDVKGLQVRNQELKSAMKEHKIFDGSDEQTEEDHRLVLELIYSAINEDQTPEFNEEFDLNIDLSLDRDVKIIDYVKFNKFPALRSVLVQNIGEDRIPSIKSFLYNSFPSALKEFSFNEGGNKLKASFFVHPLTTALPAASVSIRIANLKITRYEFSQLLVAGQSCLTVIFDGCVLTDLGNFEFDFRESMKTTKVALNGMSCPEGSELLDALKSIAGSLAASHAKATLKTIEIRSEGIQKANVEEIFNSAGLAIEVEM